MSNVQLYTQVAAEVSPSLRTIVPEPEDHSGPDDEFAADVLQDVSRAPATSGMPIMAQTLRITGSRPLRFHGRHVAMATGWNNTAPRWYEINLYETDTSEIVCDVRLFNKSADDSDLYRAVRVADWQAAATWLEDYAPAHDLVCHVNVDDERLSAAHVSLRGIAIRQQILELETQFKTLAGNLLYELKITD